MNDHFYWHLFSCTRHMWNSKVPVFSLSEATGRLYDNYEGLLDQVKFPEFHEKKNLFTCSLPNFGGKLPRSLEKVSFFTIRENHSLVHHQFVYSGWISIPSWYVIILWLYTSIPRYNGGTYINLYIMAVCIKFQMIISLVMRLSTNLGAGTSMRCHLNFFIASTIS